LTKKLKKGHQKTGINNRETPYPFGMYFSPGLS